MANYAIVDPAVLAAYNLIGHATCVDERGETMVSVWAPNSYRTVERTPQAVRPFLVGTEDMGTVVVLGTIGMAIDIAQDMAISGELPKANRKPYVHTGFEVGAL